MLKARNIITNINGFWENCVICKKTYDAIAKRANLVKLLV